MPTKKATKKATTKESSPTKATAATTATASAPPVSAGDFVHYHPEGQEELTADNAHAALVLHVADSKSGRVDLLVFGKNGDTKAEVDVTHAPERAAGRWTPRDAA